MCAPSSTTFRGKVLRVGLAGIKPNVFKARNGRPDGVDVRILGLLQRKLKFRANVKIIRTLNGGFDVVGYAQCHQLIQRYESVNSKGLKKFSHDPSLQAANRSCELVISRAGYNFFQYKRVDYLSPLGRWGIYPISGRARKVPNYLTLVKGLNTCDIR